MTIHLRQICLVAEKLEPVIEDLKQVLGLQVCFRDKGVGVFGLENALLPVGTNFIEVVAPVKDDTAAGRYLTRRGGDGGYMVITQADSIKTQDMARARAKDLGVRVAWEGNHDAGIFMQLHPADCGGSFFEIDTATPYETEGFWPPANGNGWQDKVSTTRVSALVGAELQSDDPGALAEKWSAIAGIALTRDDNNRLVLPLENATLRFVKAIDGRGPGLGALDIKVTDRDAILQTAEARGLTHTETQVLICGTRINLV